MSVKSHLTSGASVRPENIVTYSAPNGGQNICGVFSETAPLQRFSTAPLKAYVLSCASLANAFSRVRARVAPRVLHFSAFIIQSIVENRPSNKQLITWFIWRYFPRNKIIYTYVLATILLVHHVTACIKRGGEHTRKVLPVK